MATKDNITPITPQDYQREIGPKIWHYEQIYRGPDASIYDDASILKRYVPAVRDIVMHDTTGDWVVTFVSEEYIPTLIPRKVNTNDTDVSDSIVIPSKNYNRRADVLHVDVSTTPIRFYVNSRVMIHGSQASHFKIFRGIEIGEHGVPISAVYNTNGKIVSDSIELELAAFDRDVTNLAIRVPKTGYLSELPIVDDIVTLVVYAQDGTYMDSHVLVVSHDNFIPTSSATRVISDIRLDSPYVSENDPSIIEIKRNMNLQSLALFGVVTYNDGSKSQRLPVGGGKFELHGMDAFTASTDLQEVDVTLVYIMGKDEAAQDSTVTASRRKTQPYTIKTMPSDAAYSVKLFVVPVWNTTTARWDLTYKLYDLRRDSTLDVTDLVEPNAAYKFDPTNYGQKQTVQVAINLMNVGSQYQFYRPVQSFNITLVRPGDSKDVPTYYLLSYSSNLQLGNNLVANKTLAGGKTYLNLSCGQTTQDEWIANVYKNLGVIYNGDTPAPPNPTKFRMRRIGTTAVTEYNFSNIVKDLEVTGSWTQGSTVLVEFFAESGNDTLELAAMSFNVNIVN